MNELKRSSGLLNNPQTIVKQLRAIHASIHLLTALGSAVVVAGPVKIAGNSHGKESRQAPEQDLCQVLAAFDEVYELLQAKVLAEEQLLRAQGYLVLARLA